jgi:hypothetical protein
MSNKQYHSLKGDFFIRDAGSAATVPFKYVGNVSAASFGMTRETVQLTSSGNDAGTLAEEETARDATLSLTLNAIQKQNLAIALYGNTVAQTAGTAATVTLPVLAAGDAFPLAHINVSNVVVTGKTAGVDYKLRAKSGVIEILTPFAAGVEVTYDHGTADAVGVFTQNAKEYEVLYASESGGMRVRFSRWQPAPATALALISTEIASLEVAGSLLKVEGGDQTFGGFAKVEKVS